MPEYICPHCKKPTHDEDALRCIYCGELLNRKIGFISNMKFSRVAIIVTILTLLSFFAFFIIRL